MDYESYKNKPNWTTKEVMHFLNCSRQTVYNYMDKGLLKAFKCVWKINSHNLFKAEEVRKLLKPF